MAPKLKSMSRIPPHGDDDDDDDDDDDGGVDSLFGSSPVARARKASLALRRGPAGAGGQLGPTLPPRPAL